MVWDERLAKVVEFAKQFPAIFSFVTRKRDALQAKSNEFALEVLCMFSLDKKGGSLHARRNELENCFKTMTSNVWAKRRSTLVKVVAG